MRALIGLAIAALFATVLAPGVSATAVPTLVWPAPEFLPREAAPNVTAWVATRLGLAADPARTPEWLPESLAFPPLFATPQEKYVWPFLGGNVTAWYNKGGRLLLIGVSGETPYIASSMDLAQLEATANRVNADLGLALDFTGAGVGLPGPGVPPEERSTSLEIDRAQLQDSGDFYSAGATFREVDLRLVSFGVSVWYRAAGTPTLSGPEAIGIAFSLARSQYNASDPAGDLGMAYVVNGSAFAYEVYVYWSAPLPDFQWFMRVWVDADTGAIVEVEGPRLQPRPVEEGELPILPVGVVAFGVAVAAAVLLALFFRLSAERALDHFTRGQIYGYIAANPGIHYTAVREALGLSNGTLEYHLWVLHRSGFVRSSKEGRLRRLFVEGGGVRRGPLVLSRVQFSILDLIHAGGPLANGEIARQLGLSRQRTHYNVKTLRSLSLVVADAEGGVRLSTQGEDFVAAAKRPAADTSHATA